MTKRLQLRLGQNHELIPHVDGVPLDGVLAATTHYDRNGAIATITLAMNSVDFPDLKDKRDNGRHDVMEGMMQRQLGYEEQDGDQ